MVARVRRCGGGRFGLAHPARSKRGGTPRRLHASRLLRQFACKRPATHLALHLHLTAPHIEDTPRSRSSTRILDPPHCCSAARRWWFRRVGTLCSLTTPAGSASQAPTPGRRPRTSLISSQHSVTTLHLPQTPAARRCSLCARNCTASSALRASVAIAHLLARLTQPALRVSVPGLLSRSLQAPGLLACLPASPLSAFRDPTPPTPGSRGVAWPT